MKNRILKFDDFKKGTPEQKPEKQVEVAGGMPKNPKEKAFDQVKRAKLAQLDKTEPDYSKVRKIEESAVEDVAKVDAQIADLDKQAAQLQTKKADLLKQKAIYATSVAKEESAATTTTTTAAPAAPAPAPAPAQPGATVPPTA